MTRRALIVTGLIGGLCAVAAFPTRTKQAVDYRLVTRTVPFAVKAAEFVLRDAEYRRLAKEITRGLTDEEARAMAVLAWTRTHIRSTPRGWPAVDDHILNVIIRGYGSDDQRADVFATLSTYVGAPSYWKIITAQQGGGKLVLAFVRIDGRWTVWDVERGAAFRDGAGRLASVHQLASDPSLIGSDRLAAYRGQPYGQYIEQALASFAVPGTLRAEDQMPLPRLLAEGRRAWHWVWQGGY